MSGPTRRAYGAEAELPSPRHRCRDGVDGRRRRRRWWWRCINREQPDDGHLSFGPSPSGQSVELAATLEERAKRAQHHVPSPLAGQFDPAASLESYATLGARNRKASQPGTFHGGHDHDLAVGHQAHLAIWNGRAGQQSGVGHVSTQLSLVFAAAALVLKRDTGPRSCPRVLNDARVPSSPFTAIIGSPSLSFCLFLSLFLSLSLSISLCFIFFLSYP